LTPTYFVEQGAVDEFEQFLNAHSIVTRPHPTLNTAGFQAHHSGHWMAVVWNKNWKRYTVDSRLATFVTQFKSTVPNKRNTDPWERPGALVAESWLEGGGYEVFAHNGSFDLYEIPQYGGDPYPSGTFATLDLAVAQGRTFT
jgi:hypothetical protein